MNHEEAGPVPASSRLLRDSSFFDFEGWGIQGWNPTLFITTGSLGARLPDKDAIRLIYCNNFFASPSVSPSRKAFSSLGLSMPAGLYDYGCRTSTS